jgi:hypothetical protein
MKEDEVLILLYLHENPGSTTTEIGKNLFAERIAHTEIGDPERRKRKETEALRNEDRRVRYYLDRFVADNLVTVATVNRKKRYTLVPDNVHLGLARIEMITLKGDEVSIGLGRVLLCNLGTQGIDLMPIPEENGGTS